MNLISAMRRNAAREPELQIYTYLGDGETETSTLTFAEIDRQARVIAAHLQTLYAPGARAIVIYPTGLQVITGILGCIYSGIALVPSLPVRENHPPETLLGIVEDTQAQVVLTTHSMAGSLRETFAPYPTLNRLPIIATDDIAQTLDAEGWREPELTPSSLIALMYTSGSTRSARGVVLRHGKLMQNIVQAVQRTERVSASGPLVTWKPIYHGTGMGDFLFYPMLGAVPTVILPTNAFLERPVRWLRAMTQYKAFSSGGPNFGYQLCVDKVTPEERAGLDLTAWRVATVGTEPIQPRILQAFSETYAPYGFQKQSFVVTYGLTEGAMSISVGRGVKTLDLDRDALEQNRVVLAVDSAEATRLVSCGPLNRNVTLCIVDPSTLQVCAPERIGEIWLSSEDTLQEYWNKPEETQRTFQAMLAGSGEGPFLRTGDMGFMYENELYIAGRLKDMIILRGRNLYSEDIEQVAGRAHPALLPGAAAAFSIPHEGIEQLAIVHEVKAGAANLNVEEIAGAIRREVAREMQLPVEMVVLVQESSLPRTPSGKVQRYLCRAQLMVGQA